MSGDSTSRPAQVNDNFFMPLGNNKPFLKVAFQGFAGCGKTYTMALIAAGLHARIGSTKPIVIFDTEHAAKFLAPFFRERKIQVLHKESRSLADLKETMRRCRDGIADILMIDSISHIWENYLNAYLTKKNRTRLQFEDWGVIKPTWKAEFSEPFVRDQYHTLMTGRAGYEYEDEKDEDGKRQIFKSGVKMKVEGETAYEPDMLVYMTRHEDVVGHEKRVWREATILKDRSAMIDGQTFPNPTFESFAPALDYILENPDASIHAAETDAASLFTGSDEARKQFAIRKEIALEEIEGEMVKVWPGATAEAKRAKATALDATFETTSWKAVTMMSAERLEQGVADLRVYIEARKAEAAVNEAAQ